jgi:5-hydroxyisourate hydrolase
MITTHVLDTSTGKPGAAVPVTLEFLVDGVFVSVGHGETDADGRLKTLLDGAPRAAGTYRITFETAAYFKNAPCFFPTVSIVFVASDLEGHYHVPLLISPFGYSTYRGS